MTVRLKNSAEAFLAVAAVAIAADKLGSLAERQVLFERVRRLDVFKEYSETGFSELVSDVTERVCKEAITADMTISRQAISDLIMGAKAILSSEQQRAVLAMATDLCNSDGLAGEEIALLSQLRQAFDVS